MNEAVLTGNFRNVSEYLMKKINPFFSGKRQTFFKAVGVLKNVCNRSSRKDGLDFY